MERRVQRNIAQRGTNACCLHIKVKFYIDPKCFCLGEGMQFNLFSAGESVRDFHIRKAVEMCCSHVHSNRKLMRLI